MALSKFQLLAYGAVIMVAILLFHTINVARDEARHDVKILGDQVQALGGIPWCLSTWQQARCTSCRSTSALRGYWPTSGRGIDE